MEYKTVYDRQGVRVIFTDGEAVTFIIEDKMACEMTITEFRQIASALNREAFG